MKTLKNSFVLTAIAVLGIVSCNEASLTPDLVPEEGKLVTVHFGTENTDPSTKATLTPNEGETAFDAAWEVDDVISVYYLNDELTEGTISATWNGKSFTAELPQYTGEWDYRAAYPVPDAGDKHVDFGPTRTQKGNAYNSKYDIMVGKASANNAAAGKDDSDKDIVFQMERQTAIAYFHFTSSLDEDITKATLTVSGDDAAIASNYAYVSNFEWAPAKDCQSITITFPEVAPKANDFQLWFNVLETSYESMSLTVETANKTFTISKTTKGVYEKGKLYKVKRSDISWTDKAETPSIPFFYESFDKIDGTGGNDGKWSGSIASNDVNDDNLDNAGWVFVKQGGASKCLKLGSGDTKGTATTPSLGITTGTASICFKAGAWNGKSENTTISLSASSEGTTVTPSEITLVKGEWTEYECTISGADSETKIVFSANTASNNRFFLDEVCVYYGEKPSKPVIKQDQTITFAPTSYTATIGAENKYPTLTAQSSGATTWASSDTGVATIDAESGEITLVAAGTTTISVTVAADETYNEGTGRYELTVTGGGNPGVTTVSLDESEIKSLGKIAYTDKKEIIDGTITWTVYALKEVATRPYLQLKKDKGVYVKISAPSAIKEVRLTITSATNSKGGVEDISKHTAYSSDGTISLKSADAVGNTTTNDVASCAGSEISNNSVTLIPTGDYKELYLKVSTGARIWGVEVDY